MRSIALVLLLLASVTLTAAQSNSQAPTAPPSPANANAAANAKQQDCTILGMVVAMAGSVPLKNALVTLNSVDDRSRAEVTIRSEADGHFQFRGIIPGQYRLRVARNNYVTQEYGQRTVTGPGATLTLRAGQEMKDLLFRLIPSATIAGRVQDEDGEPISWAHVTALRSSYANGKRTFKSVATNTTNDLGEYRLFGLPPGRYFISATYHPGAAHGGFEEDFDYNGADSLKENYVLTYYPGAYDATKAQSITVKSGEEIPSMDFTMRPTAVYRVRGRVINTIPNPKHVDHPMVFIMPRGGAIQSESMTFSSNNEVKKDGTFDLPGVAPGSYTIQAMINDGDEQHAVTQSVEVGDADVEGVQLVLSKGFSVSGHVRWDGTPGHVEDDLYLMGHMDGQSLMIGGYARIDRDGSFTWNELSDGALHLQFGGLNNNGYIKAADYGGVDVLEQGFTPRAGSNATLEVTLSAQGAQIEGTATDENGLPVVGVWVVLVPDAKHRDRHDLYRTERTDQHGVFKIKQIAPGDYTLYSWDEVEDGAWEDPDFLRPFERKKQGEKITLQDRDDKSYPITVIKTSAIEGQKQ
ncbi:MAG TPA: carboxypeptidase-like regulatory domain-containing protein [Candidatus Acidoferrum sp.]|jgi:protocatechuate 3,4-dioxygenase beta subunit